MSLLNPMNISSPNAPAPYQQPATAAPTPNAQVASYPVGANVLQISEPVAPYYQSGGSSRSGLLDGPTSPLGLQPWQILSQGGK